MQVKIIFNTSNSCFQENYITADIFKVFFNIKLTFIHPPKQVCEQIQQNASS